MRRFHSYGPVDPTEHFCVERRELVEQCVQQLVGNPDKGGHFFTIWAPRQTGKTWVMRRSIESIRARYGERFLAATLSMEGLFSEDDTEESFLRAVPRLFQDGLLPRPAAPEDWDACLQLFAREGGAFDKPAILLIDEFDSLPPASSTSWWACSAGFTRPATPTPSTGSPLSAFAPCWGPRASAARPSMSSARCGSRTSPATR